MVVQPCGLNHELNPRQGQAMAKITECRDAPLWERACVPEQREARRVEGAGGTDRERKKVRHSAAQNVRYLAGETVHTNGVESFWSMLKRANKGVYHRLSPKHLQAYVDTFAARQNVQEMDTLAQMQHVVAGLIGKRLTYCNLTADNARAAMAT